jgi:hypothetical protein
MTPKNDHKGQELARCGVHHEPETGADQTALLGHQHSPKRGETGEVFDRRLQDPVQPFARDQVDGDDRGPVGRVDGGNTQLAEQPGQQNEPDGEDREQGGGVGEGVAESFDRGQKSGEKRVAWDRRVLFAHFCKTSEAASDRECDVEGFSMGTPRRFGN